MTLPLWGQLQKAQDDPETIEEAIARLIGEHEADPEAHLGTGESLEQHKTEPVLNHPAGAVLADKWSMTEFQIEANLQSLVGITTQGVFTNNTWPSVLVGLEGDSVTRSGFRFSLPLEEFLVNDKEHLFQMLAEFSEDLSIGDFTMEMRFGNDYGVTFEGYGFVLDATGLRAFVRRGSSNLFSSYITHDIFSPTVYRAHYVPFDNLVRYYLNGVQVASLTPPAGTWSITPNFYFKIDSENEAEGGVHIADIFISREA